MTDYDALHEEMKDRKEQGERATPEEIAKVVLIMGDGNPQVGLDTLKVLETALPIALADEITQAMEDTGMIPEGDRSQEAFDQGVEKLPDVTAKLFSHWALDHMDSVTGKIREAIDELEDYLKCRNKIQDTIDKVEKRAEKAPTN